MPKMRRVSILLALTTLSLATAGCQKKAEGQVVAVVNGEEITLNELNNELGDLNLPPNVDKEKVRNLVLKRIVDRRLLVQAAKQAGLDRDPQFINQERRMREQLLVRMYGKKALDTIPVPSNTQIDQFISKHPAMFNDRVRYNLNQIAFKMPSDPKSLAQLQPEHSLDAVAQKLTQMGIKFQRGTATLDSATVPPDALKHLQALPPGEPFIVPNGDQVVVSSIVGDTPIQLKPDQSRPIAVQAMRSDELNKIGEQRLQESLAKAKISYQKGFAPPADADKAAKEAAKLPSAAPAPGAPAPATPKTN